MSNQTKEASKLSMSWKLSIAVMLTAAAVLAPDFALAASTDTPFGNMFCTVQSWFRGNIGKGLATIAVTIIGIGALLGKVSWGMALIVGTGIAIVFGAIEIVDALNQGADAGCTTDGTFGGTT